MPKIPQYLLNLAGEYRVCSELAKRGVFATITAGNRKSVDLYAINDLRQKALKIEVKTSQVGKFLTGIGQKGLANDPSAPDFWVLFQLLSEEDGRFSERFFILTHGEICEVQEKHNQAYRDKYFGRHGREPDFSRGVDNVTLEQVVDHEDRWDKILDVIGVISR